MDLDRAEKVLNLYDSCWFELEIFKKPPFLSNSSSYESKPEEITQKTNVPQKPEENIPRVLTHHNRSMSDQLNTNTSFSSGSLSPDHSPPKLLTIHSGKEIGELKNPEAKTVEVAEKPKRKVKNGRRRTRKGGESKSLSELEFEELKGFMDLGFVFSEEDRESSLASIIPGLQRLGKNKEEKEEQEDEEEESVVDDGSEISRPYLSEAWEVFDLMPKRENPLMNWKIPALSNKIGMKDSLRWWAHTVASTVR
ncbi:hypothetical protein TIFTF001_012707 [Ficus carica]|uniref:Uncharacterized protein n=1 Tax=Ficus carica TaxID=3494 RepID=A0AA88DI46_FICCA|nr:hypothetical protein TIFTF001_012707 [Ficus carica]